MISRVITDYKEAEQFLYDLPKFTKKNDLGHTKELLNRLGNPAIGIPKVHVAGTNGKGSVCAYLQSLFQKSGKKTGGFVSPHLVTVHERFLINSKPVSDLCFMEGVQKVKAVADSAYKEGLAYPTFFEFLFLVGMYIFQREQVDVLILETGLGGRLDATNMFDCVEACVITAIGLDHCQYLGDTREAIATEKAGIIKKNADVIYMNREDGATDVIRKKCLQMGGIDGSVGQKEYSVEKIKYKSIDFSYKSGYYNYISLFVSTNALYQVENAVLALRTFEKCAEKMGLSMLSEVALQEAIADTFWEGRMEEVLPDVYFDGAHNENGMQAFLESVKTMEIGGSRHLCFSAVDDKDYERMIAMLGESRLFSNVTIIEMEEERGVSLEELQRHFSRYDHWTVHAVKGAKQGLHQCLLQKQEGDVVFIVGSLYLVGLIKAVLRRN